MTLQDLEKRLSKATVADRWWTSDEADAWAVAIFGPKATFVDWGMLTAAFTSLDAAIALCERVLPGHAFGIRGPWVYAPEHESAGVTIWDAEIVLSDCGTPPFENADETAGGSKPTPALALCLAIVRALIAKEGKQ